MALLDALMLGGITLALAWSWRKRGRELDALMGLHEPTLADCTCGVTFTDEIDWDPACPYHND